MKPGSIVKRINLLDGDFKEAARRFRLAVLYADSTGHALTRAKVRGDERAVVKLEAELLEREAEIEEARARLHRCTTSASERLSRWRSRETA